MFSCMIISEREKQELFQQKAEHRHRLDRVFKS